MATSGGGSSLPSSSAYGANDGSVGGKFQKRFFSKSRPTPYDRPRTALRNPNWVSKLFIDPASKLVAASARRFFSSVFQKRLPPSSKPQLLLPPPGLNPEMNSGAHDFHIPVAKHSEVVQSTAVADSQILMRKDSCGISELELLLKQKTLTRHEIDRLTELLQSKAVDFPVKNDAERDVSSHLKPVKLKDFWFENTRNGQGSHQATLTPGSSARVLGEDITAPAELAIAHVGCPLKESPGTSFLENRYLLRNLPSPNSSVMSWERTTTGEVNVQKNGFSIPRSRGRSAIYRMAGTSFLRMHQTTSGKESECNGSLLASPTLLKQNGEPGSKDPARKRSSAMLDDDVGSVGPIRRTRGRHGLVSHNASLPFGGKDVSNGAVQPLPPNYKGFEDTNKASTSYCHVPPSFHESASGLLQKDEHMKQKEELSESKLTTDREKSLSGKVLKSLQSEDSLKLLEGAKNGEKLEDLSHRSLNGINSFNSQKQKRAEENDLKKSGSDTVSTDQKLSSSVPSDLPTVHLAQATRKKHGFKMSVDEDFFDLDEGTYCNGPAAESSVEEREHKTTSFDQNQAFAGNLNLNKTHAFVETRKTPVEPVATSENSSASFAFQTLTVPAKTLQPVVHPPSSSSEKSKYISEVSTPKFSSWVEPVPSSSNRPGGANNHSPQTAKHEENNLEEGVKGKGKPDALISVPFSSSISSSISAPILPEPSNINNGPTNLSAPAHTSATSSSLELPALQFASSNATSSAVSLPVAFNAESSAFKNKSDIVANVTSASMSPFDITSTAPLSNGSNLFGLGSRTDSSAGNYQSQGAGSIFGSTVVTVPEITPSLLGSSALTSTGTSGFASIAPFNSSTPATGLFGSTPSFGISNLSSLSGLKSDTSGSNISSSIFTSSSTVSTAFSAASAVSSISSSIPNNIISFGTGSLGSAAVTNVLSNVATTLNTMPSTSSSSGFNVASTSSISPTLFGSSGETTKPGVAFGSTINPASPSNLFPFAASPAFTAPSIVSPLVFGAAASSAPVSSFPTASPSPTPFTNFPSTFMSNSNNDQMSPVDSMAEDPVQSQPVVGPAPVFGQHPVPSMPPGISFGSVVPPAAAPTIQFNGQPSQSPMLQGQGNFETSNGGKFSLGSAGGDDKSSRRIVRVRNRLRK